MANEVILPFFLIARSYSSKISKVPTNKQSSEIIKKLIKIIGYKI